MKIKFQKTFELGFFLVIFAFFARYISLFVIASSNSTPWSLDHIVPNRMGRGIDYKSVFDYVEALLSGISPYAIPNNFNVYPPFVTLFNVPWSVFRFNVSYKIEIFLLSLSNIIVIWLFLKMFVFKVINSLKDRLFFFFSFVVMQFISYGFFFSVERGNYDIFALLFALFFIVSLQKDRFFGDVFLSSLFLTIAIHLKVYPLMLMPLLFLRFKYKAFAPFVLLNILFCFCLGVGNFFEFYRNVVVFTTQPYYWVGNHSAASFAQIFAKYFHISSRIATLGFLFVPILLWFISNLVIFIRKRKDFNLIYFVSSIFLMCFLPSVSHDYKLVLMIIPLIFCFMKVSDLFHSTGKMVYVFMGVFLVVLYLDLSSPNTLPLFVRNKYPAMLVLMLVTCIFIFVDYFTYKRLADKDSFSSGIKEQDKMEQAQRDDF